MSILKVARMGHPVLRAKAKALSPADIKHAVVQGLIDDMLDTMDEYHGVGLAAPQIHEGLRIFVGVIESGPSDAGKDADAEPIALINPEITPIGDEVVEEWEGCLSIPDIRGPRAAHERNSPARLQSRKTASASSFVLKDFHAARRAARDRSPRRHPVFRSHAHVRAR